MNINELLNGYACTNGKWNKKGDIKDLLSRDDLLRLLQQKFSKPGVEKKEIKEMVLLIFKHATENRGPCPITEYPIVGSHPGQMLYANTPYNEVNCPYHDTTSETPLPLADVSALFEQINGKSFDRVGRIGWLDTVIITIPLIGIRVGIKQGRAELFINVIDGTISLGKIRFRSLQSC
ncbi:MAG: hypothetical protein LBT03_01980 [Holosporales bacterium]|jgi:hypothetical protein|nr:hypothetical protein [Holosporales bacterium]